MAGDRRSIGQVLKVLVGDFSDVSISKIRFLESEGLLTPERAPSGYRRYSDEDITRLRYILTAQKQHYLPLRVIKEHLDALDRGEEPPAFEAIRPDGEAEQEHADPPPLPVPGTRAPKHPIRITRKELLRMSGLTDAALTELERQSLVVPRRGTVYYGRDALTVAVVARKLSVYGMDARHLRSIKYAAEREVGLIEQAVTVTSRRGQSTRQSAQEVMQLVLHAHAAMLRSTLT